MCPDDGTQLRHPKNDPLIGKVFADRYEIQSVLGVGGMSIVYKAKHRLMNRSVAIKMLHKSFKEDIQALERFKLEAEAASSLSHQNVITVYDFGVTPDGEPFFVMDCLEGESLHELIQRKGRLGYERALPVFIQICDGLDAAHKKGIVHRDLKPANVVLITPGDGTEFVKLVDFGIAKMLPQAGREQQNLTRTGEVFGSPICMSPEQCLGKPLDGRTDIYALGCLMYETLTGTPPFMGDSFLVTMNKHVGEAPKAMRQVAPEATIPPELEELVLRCMAKSPDDRCQSAGEVGEILAGIAMKHFGSSGRHASNISTRRAVITHARFKPSVSLIVAVVVASLLIGGGCFCTFWPGPVDDSGSPLNKIGWQILMSDAHTAIQDQNFVSAESKLQAAESRARTFGDNQNRLEQTLRIKAELYGQWDGHAEDLEKTNNEIVAIQVDRLRRELQIQLKLLDSLSQPTTSAVHESSTRLIAEAQIPSILSTSDKLYGRALYSEQEQLLRKTFDVEKKLLGSESVSVAKLATKLSECLIAQRTFVPVRPFLVDACRIYKHHLSENPAQYVQTLSQLAQFDLDQSDFKAAESELAEALLVARKLLGHRDTLVLCLRSYSDLLRQTNRKEESQRLLQEADVLEKLPKRAESK